MMIAHHVERCIERWGGTADLYEPISTFLDSTKLYLSDWRHRILLHSTLGVMWVEELFPKIITHKNIKAEGGGYSVSARTVAEQHILEDLGLVPTAKWMLRELPSYKLTNVSLHHLLTEEELRLIYKIRLLTYDKAYIYFSNLGVDLFTQKFGYARVDRYSKAFMTLTDRDKLLRVEDVLETLPINKWLGGLNSKQIKGVQRLCIK